MKTHNVDLYFLDLKVLICCIIGTHNAIKKQRPVMAICFCYKLAKSLCRLVSEIPLDEDGNHDKAYYVMQIST